MQNHPHGDKVVLGIVPHTPPPKVSAHVSTFSETGKGEKLYTHRYTVTTRMTYALRWAAMRAILMFHNCEGQSHKTVSTDHNF